MSLSTVHGEIMQGSLIGIVVGVVVWMTTAGWGWGIGAGIASGIAWDLWRQRSNRDD
ncbi:MULTISPECIES: hypothetical protein [Salinicola]|uniref:hypothetical protein n=1 Tax=Salinicola TaxID=404432 RepID=UPI0013006478|nr:MULTISPECIES: hypothetical protein [Salinicola]